MTNEKLTKKNLNYKPYIKHIKYNNNIKHIYVKNHAGFGNKIYDLIFAIYLYNLYNTKNNTNNENIYKNPDRCIINYVIMRSAHQKHSDPSIDNIFPNSKHKINFISDVSYHILTNNQNIKFSHIETTEKPNNDSNNINVTNGTNTAKILESLDTFPKYEDLTQHTIITNNYKLVYEIYSSLSQKDKDIFLNFNKNILSDKFTLDSIMYKPYSIAHIRYGDKLNYLKYYINKPDVDITTLLNAKKGESSNIDQFLLYTPEYYIDKINELLETTNENMNVYIITDSVNIVKQFIMNNPSIKNNSRIVLLDKMTWWDSFYLLYYASNIILSDSTFAFAGAYFNKRRAKCEMVIYHHDYNNPFIEPSEYAISPDWKITNERKYILNYSPKIAYMIIKYKYFWTD